MIDNRVRERCWRLERFVTNKLNSWAPDFARAYRQNRDNRTASRPPSPTPYGFKFSGPRPISNYETDEIEIFLQYLQRSSVCIDIGANVGLYSCLAMRCRKQVLAVEPNPVNLQRLYRNLIANDYLDVELYPVGLSNEPGLKRLYGTGLNASFIAGWARTKNTLYTVAPLTTLDILAGTRFDGLQVTIKIDVEGLEFQVLQGATQTLTLTPKPFWLIEIVLTEQIPGGINTRMYDTFEIFWRNGYQARTADRERKLVKPQDVERWVATGSRDFGSYNYLFEAR